MPTTDELRLATKKMDKKAIDLIVKTIYTNRTNLEKLNSWHLPFYCGNEIGVHTAYHTLCGEKPSNHMLEFNQNEKDITTKPVLLSYPLSERNRIVLCFTNFRTDTLETSTILGTHKIKYVADVTYYITNHYQVNTWVKLDV